MQARIPANSRGGKVRHGASRLSWGTCVLLGAVASACGSESRSSPAGFVPARSGGTGGSAASGGTPGTGGTSASAGTPAVVVTGGSSGTSPDAGSGTGASAGLDGACQSQTFAGMRVPLDLYLMLDGSDSMNEDTGNGTTTKWDAVGNAIRSFVNDPASSGIGLGLQFFPLQNPDAPTVCHKDSDCTGFGACNQRFCQNAGPGFYICAKDSDCVTDTGDFGPCAMFTHCWSSLVETGALKLCHNDAECGLRNDCIPFAHCGDDVYRFCSVPGQNCDNNYGPCHEEGLPSTCQHAASCDADIYAAPAVDIAELPDVAPAVITAITAHQPDGNTPSSPALAGAIQQAHDWALAHGNHEVAVVLATDGLPSECIADPNGDPGGITGVTTAAAAGLAGTPSVRTFVIGVFAESETDAPGNLNEIAKAGGTDQAFVVTTGNDTDVQQEFEAALDSIRGSGISCELQIPVPESGKTDFGRVNVYFTEGDATQALYFAGDEAGCAAGKGDWYYGTDDTGAPTKIIACPDTCARFEATTTGTVTIGVGCITIVR